jgi:hypothetical protein
MATAERTDSPLDFDMFRVRLAGDEHAGTTFTLDTA